MLVGEFGSSRIDLKVRPHWHSQTLEQKRAVLNDLFLRQKEIRNPIGGESFTGSRWKSERGGDDLNGVATGL